MVPLWRLGVSLKQDSQESPPRNKNVAGSVPSYAHIAYGEGVNIGVCDEADFLIGDERGFRALGDGCLLRCLARR